MKKGRHRRFEEARALKRTNDNLDDLFGHVGEVEFDWPPATRLEVDEQRPVLRAEHVARVRLTVQELLGGATVADHSSQAS